MCSYENLLHNTETENQIMINFWTVFTSAVNWEMAFSGPLGFGTRDNHIYPALGKVGDWTLWKRENTQVKIQKQHLLALHYDWLIPCATMKNKTILNTITRPHNDHAPVLKRKSDWFTMHRWPDAYCLIMIKTRYLLYFQTHSVELEVTEQPRTALLTKKSKKTWPI